MTAWHRRLLGYTRGHWPRLGMLMLCGALIMACEVIAPWPIKLLLDYVIVDQPLPNGWGWLGMLAGGDAAGLIFLLAVMTIVVFMVRRLFAMGEAYLKVAVGSSLMYACAEDVYDVLQRRSAVFFGKQSVGDLMRRVGDDTNCVRDLFINVCYPMFSATITLVVVALVMWQIDRLMAIVALVVIIPMGVVVYVFNGSMTRRGYVQAEREGELVAKAERTLTAVPLVQAMSQEQREDKLYSEATDSTMRAYLVSLFLQLGFGVTVTAVMGVATAGLFLIGGFRVSQGYIGIGDLYVFLAYLVALYAPIEMMAQASTTVALARARSQRLQDVLEQEDPIQEPMSPLAVDTQSIDPAGAAVRLLSVRHGYEQGRPVLCDIDLEITPGKTFALVGASGVGKTTLASLIPRFADPWEGEVRLNGVDVRKLSFKDLRQQIAWVPQDPMLLPMTIAENIAFAEPSADRERIIEAAKAAQLHQHIEKMIDGYDTIVGERGSSLSGGQAQRLSIARALLKRAPLVILDEPTSALDVQTERDVMAAIRELSKHSTIIIIAHRLSTIRAADTIVVLEAGRVIEQGSHDQLFKQRGAYYRFLQIQLGDGFDPTTPDSPTKQSQQEG